MAMHPITQAHTCHPKAINFPSPEETQWLLGELEKYHKQLRAKDADMPDVSTLPTEDQDGDQDNASAPDESPFSAFILDQSKPQVPAINLLMAMTGLEEVKEAITRQLSFHRIMSMRKAAGYKVPVRLMHMLLTGNPGSGKTTVARLIARIYHEAGILSRPTMIERNRAQLVGRFIGTTEQLTIKAIEDAKGGVLFIDEIYSLAEKNSDSSQSDFGYRAIDTLMPILSDPDSDIIVIGAGYADEMKRFISANPGLSSRFPLVLDFKDFTLDQLIEIAVNHLAKFDFTLTPDALDKMKATITSAMRTKNHGNARMVINMIDSYIIPNLCMRLDKTMTFSGLDIKASGIILPQDIPSATELMPLAADRQSRLGFCR